MVVTHKLNDEAIWKSVSIVVNGNGNDKCNFLNTSCDIFGLGDVLIIQAM